MARLTTLQRNDANRIHVARERTDRIAPPLSSTDIMPARSP